MTEKNRGGRPFSLVADEVTLKTIRGLGNIQATTKECAAVLNVTERTFITFKQKNPKAVEAYESGSGEGLASLRRRQFKAAQDGNATMLIWLGKQYLGQSDKVVNEHSGPAGGPIETKDVSAREFISRRIAGIAARNGASGDTGAAKRKSG